MNELNISINVDNHDNVRLDVYSKGDISFKVLTDNDYSIRKIVEDFKRHVQALNPPPAPPPVEPPIPDASLFSDAVSFQTSP